LAIREQSEVVLETGRADHMKVECHFKRTGTLFNRRCEHESRLRAEQSASAREKQQAGNQQAPFAADPD
jgi:hypothetical protein